MTHRRTKSSNNNNEQPKLGMMMTQFFFLRRGHALSLVMIFAMSVGMLGAWLHLDLANMIPTASDTSTFTFIPTRRVRGLDHHNGQVALVVVETTNAAGIEGDDDDAHPAAADSSASSASATTMDSVVEEEDWLLQQPDRGTDILKEQDEQGQSDPSPLNLVICTRVRDEAPYLREWIEYHRMIGFDGVGSFLIMNDASTDDTQCILDAYAKQGVVVRVPQDFRLDNLTLRGVRDQGSVFDACVEYLARTLNAQQMASTWLLTHDVDEFVWLNNSKMADDSGGSSLKDSIRLLTKQHEHVQSLRFPRLMFGSAGHDFYEPGVLAIERYTYRFDADSCPSKKQQAEQQEQQQLHDRRRLFNQKHPTSYCDANPKKLYDDHKSMTVMSAIARDCWDGSIDPVTSKKRVARCTNTHNHELKNPTGGPTNINLTNHKGSAAAPGVGVDPRYLDALDALNTVAIMHYMTRSRQEFFQKNCGSQFAQKYFACSGCTPETYFNLTETYINLLQDTRMHAMAQKVQKVMLAANNGTESVASACNEMPPPTKPWDQYRKCWLDS